MDVLAILIGVVMFASVRRGDHGHLVRGAQQLARILHGHLAAPCRFVAIGLITPPAALFATTLATASHLGRLSISAAAAGTPQGFSASLYGHLSRAHNNGVETLAGQRVSPAGLGTMRTDNAKFVVLLLGPIAQGLTTHLYQLGHSSATSSHPPSESSY